MVSVIQTSLQAGEIAPSLHGAVDLAKYHAGLALCENAFVDYKGGATNRTGTEFIGYAADLERDVILVPFQFKTTQTYILEFSHLKMRVIKDGGFVLHSSYLITNVVGSVFTTGSVVIPPEEGGTGVAPPPIVVGDTVFLDEIVGIPDLNGVTAKVSAVAGSNVTLTKLNGDPLVYDGVYVSGGLLSAYFSMAVPYQHQHLFELKYVQSADVLTITHRSYAQRNLSREGHANWTLEEVEFGSKIEPPVLTSFTYTEAAISSTPTKPAHFAYVVTSVTKDGEESVASERLHTIPPITNISAEQGSITIFWNGVNGADGYNVYKALPSVRTDPAAQDIGIPIGVSYGFVGFVKGTSFVDSNILPDFSTSPPTHFDPFADGAIIRVNITTQGIDYTAGEVDFVINTTTGSGAILEPIAYNGKVTACLVKNQGENYRDTDTVTFTDGLGGPGTGATGTIDAAEPTGNWPGAVAYFQQRRCYASSNNSPVTIWMSQPGLFDNFDVSRPLKDDDSITADLVSKQVNDIKYMVEMPGGLITLTGGGNAWQISGGGQHEPISPLSIMADPQAYTGCADLVPITIDYDILYVQEKGSIVRDLAYNFFTNIYTGEDISVMSNHLVSGFQLRQWAWADEPHKVVWIVREEDGHLVSLTYLKAQKVQGWAKSHTKGLFRSVATIQEGNEDAVYFVVKRPINGQWVQTIERMTSRQMPYGIEDAWFVDCGLRNTLTAPEAGLTASAISGLVTFTASAAVFAAGDVGKVLRMGGGIGPVTQFVSATVVKAQLSRPIDQVIRPADPDAVLIPLPAPSGMWTLATPRTSFEGLDHLEGEWLSILADGVVHPRVRVINGTITLAAPATKVVVGIPYSSRLQTLRLDTGEPTIQGKRKKIPSVTIRVANTRGLWVGPRFDMMRPIKDELNGYLLSLFSGDYYQNLDPTWNAEGQLCVLQKEPLPMTVLAFVPDVIIGDTYGGR